MRFFGKSFLTPKDWFDDPPKIVELRRHEGQFTTGEQWTEDSESWKCMASNGQMAEVSPGRQSAVPWLYYISVVRSRSTQKRIHLFGNLYKDLG